MKKRVMAFIVILSLLLVNAMSAAASYVSNQGGESAALGEEMLLIPGEDSLISEQADSGEVAGNSEDSNADMFSQEAEDELSEQTEYSGPGQSSIEYNTVVEDGFADQADSMEEDGFADQADSMEGNEFAGQADSMEGEGFAGQADSMEEEEFGDQADSMEEEGFAGQADSLDGDEFAGQADSMEEDEFAGQADSLDGDEFAGQPDSMAGDESADYSNPAEGELSEVFDAVDESGLSGEKELSDDNNYPLPDEAGIENELISTPDLDDQGSDGTEADYSEQVTADKEESVSSDESDLDEGPGREEISDVAEKEQADTDQMNINEGDVPIEPTEADAAATEQELVEKSEQTEAVEENPTLGTEEDPVSLQDGIESGVQKPETESIDTVTEEVPGEEALSTRLTENEDTVQALSSPESGLVVVFWNQAEGVDGYQIQCCSRENFDFSSGAAGISARVEGADRVTETLPNLTSGKIYYVRIRSYRGTSDNMITSDWENLGEITVK